MSRDKLRQLTEDQLKKQQQEQEAVKQKKD